MDLLRPAQMRYDGCRGAHRSANAARAATSASPPSTNRTPSGTPRHTAEAGDATVTIGRCRIGRVDGTCRAHARADTAPRACLRIRRSVKRHPRRMRDRAGYPGSPSAPHRLQRAPLPNGRRRPPRARRPPRDPRQSGLPFATSTMREWCATTAAPPTGTKPRADTMSASSANVSSTARLP